ncbi:hypothetical protein DSO57_1002763 [Entomophthora muscae]|uniref:Uncharacterized protein n=1 Tax=Entomophthora muscae TaxID=34485 RepID=A0ACC2RNE4_9FUNG|nr:hypothetical protein DSO57_1002763 [Entomophthora muscae]
MEPHHTPTSCQPANHGPHNQLPGLCGPQDKKLPASCPATTHLLISLLFSPLATQPAIINSLGVRDPVLGS